MEDMYIGSAGALIAATMETAGHLLQSKMLDTINGPYGRGLGALIFLIGILIALITTSLGGKYKFGLWLLLGPGLFYFVLGLRVDSSGANWKFGSSQYETSITYDIATSLNQEQPENNIHARVSWVFARWNSFTSSLVQGVVHVLMLLKDEQSRHLDKLMQNTDLYKGLLNMEMDNASLDSLTQVVFVKECLPYLSLQMEKYSDPQIYDDHFINSRLESIRSQTAFSSGDESFRILKKAITEDKLLEEADHPKLEGILSLEPDKTRDFTCDDLWQIVFAGTKRWAKRLVTQLEAQQVREGREVDNKLMTKVVEKFSHGSDSYEEAENYLLNTITTRTFLNSMKRIREGTGARDGGLLLGQIHDAENERYLPFNQQEKLDMQRNSTLMNASYEYDGKGYFLMASLGLPYLQGVALYFLAWCFPWFAFALLVPGRHASFLYWFGLWFWLKSWDIGFAFVLLVDDILFYLLPSGPAFTDDTAKSMDKAFQLAFQADPMYSANVYYMLMATLVAAVPILCAGFVKKGAGEIVTALGQGFDSFASQVGNSMASYNRNLAVQRISAAVEKRKIAAGRAAYNEAMNSPFYVSAMALGVGAPQVMDVLSSQIAAAENSGTLKDRQKSRVLRQIYNTMGEASKAGAEVSKTELMNLAKAYLVYERTMALWGEGLSEKTIMAAADARAMKFFSHELFSTFGDNVSGIQGMQVALARLTNMGDKLDKLPSQWASNVLNDVSGAKVEAVGAYDSGYEKYPTNNQRTQEGKDRLKEAAARYKLP